MTISNFSKETQVFAQRVVLELQNTGHDIHNTTDEDVKIAGLAVLDRDRQITEMMLDLSEATKQFRNAMAIRVYLACKRLGDTNA